MKATVFTVATVVSLALFLIFAVLWGAEGHLLIYRDWPYIPEWNFLGFRTIHNVEYGTGWIIPCWFLCAVTSLLPILWVIWLVQHRRTGQKDVNANCRSCGYSLTGNTSGTCPECGTAVPQRSRPA
jgi:hypothetical protein